MVELFDNLDKKLNLENQEKRFFKLKKTSLEEYYPDLDQEIYNEFKREIGEAKDYEDKGHIKRLFAQKIAKKINNSQDFELLFNGELNFLVKT